MEPNLFIDLPKTHYAPGETIRGTLLWALNSPPEVVRLQLGWWTEGKGTRDAKVVAEREWTTRASAGQESFEITLPASPYSFSGHLISLHWALDLSLHKGNETHSLQLTVGPGPTPVELPLIDAGGKQPFSLFGGR